MLGIVFYLLLLAVIRYLRKTRSPRPQGVCATCVFAHIQYSPTGRIATFCTYGQVVRPVAIEVMYCTDYRDRCVPPRLTVIGFVRPAPEPELAAAAAAGESVASAASAGASAPR